MEKKKTTHRLLKKKFPLRYPFVELEISTEEQVFRFIKPLKNKH